MDDAQAVLAEVQDQILRLGITEGEAATRIGVTVASLCRHLNGAYVRSDSLAKYRRWLAGDSVAHRSAVNTAEPNAQIAACGSDENIPPLELPSAFPTTPYRVVDLFAGCGGLSLGFELAADGRLFRPTLAVDIEEPMVRVFNANHPAGESGHPVGRQANLADFLNESEVLAFYLDHVASLEGDDSLRDSLSSLKPWGLDRLLVTLARIDQSFVDELAAVRSSQEFKRHYTATSKPSLQQTSFKGFHDALKLPLPGLATPSLGPLLWKHPTVAAETSCGTIEIPRTICAQEHRRAEKAWAAERKKLGERANGRGDGQLASAATKIRDGLKLIDSDAYRDVRTAWLRWTSARQAARRTFFEEESISKHLRHIYDSGYQAHVLLGGPPCQGFSRIGRGKIRSLREQGVHVQADQRAGDSRNELLYQYVLFVSALAPPVFVFENVRHFQAEVSTPEGTFRATDLLAEAISNVSRQGLAYTVASRVIVASDHGVPQSRERYFMVGAIRDGMKDRESEKSVADCLLLPRVPPVPLKQALIGLPAPVASTQGDVAAGGMTTELSVSHSPAIDGGSCKEYCDWVRQKPPKTRPEHSAMRVDAHCIRDSRADDRAFFQLLGPGKRWMDYRCDASPLVDDLAKVVQWAAGKSARSGGPAGLTQSRLRELLECLDGSLSIRLLLDSIQLPPGELQHHLCSPNYLKKREGSHGDWLARLDGESPSKTMVAHMGKDTYAYVHPSQPRTISVREAARIQSFPDWFRFSAVGLVDAFRIIGNAVPPLLSKQLSLRVAQMLDQHCAPKVLPLVAKQGRTAQRPKNLSPAGQARHRKVIELNHPQ